MGDLVALGKVGIEIVFAGEARTLVHGAIQGDRGAHGHFDRAFVQDGKRAGETEAHRTDVRVWRIAETRRAAAEDFGFGEKLYVDFEADDRLVFRQDFRRHGRFVGNRFRHKERHIIASAGGVVRLRRGNTSPPPPRAPRTAEKLASPCADRVAGAHGEIRRQLVAAEPADLAVLPGSRFVAWPDKSCPRYAGE